MLSECRIGMLVKYVSVPPLVPSNAKGVVVKLGPENEVKVRWYDDYQCIGEWWCSLFDLEELTNGN